MKLAFYIADVTTVERLNIMLSMIRELEGKLSVGVVKMLSLRNALTSRVFLKWIESTD